MASLFGQSRSCFTFCAFNCIAYRAALSFVIVLTYGSIVEGMGVDPEERKRSQ